MAISSMAAVRVATYTASMSVLARFSSVAPTAAAVAHLHGEITLVAKPLDLVHLGFQSRHGPPYLF